MPSAAAVARGTSSDDTPSQPRTHAAVREDLIHHAAHHVHRDREADALDAEVLRQHRGVDADQLAAAC